jgi:integrase
MLKEPKERIREASQGEEQAFMRAIRGDYAPALRFAILTGCRRMEIVDLTWSNVDFFAIIITVIGKGNKTRMIPMTKAVYDLLWDEKRHHPTAMFSYEVRRTRKKLGLVRGSRRPITKEGFKTEWRRTLVRAGIKNFRFNDTRHTAATRTLRAGNLKVVQQMLGHEDIATTAKYAHAMMDDMRAAMEAAMHTEIHTNTTGDAAKMLNEKKKSRDCDPQSSALPGCATLRTAKTPIFSRFAQGPKWLRLRKIGTA